MNLLRCVLNSYVPVSKSKLQIELEKQGHIFRAQESLHHHEKDEKRSCYCGRPVKKEKKDE